MSDGQLVLMIVLLTAIWLSIFSLALSRLGNWTISISDWVKVASAATLFVFVCVGAINTATDGKGNPQETAPFFIIVAGIAGGLYLRRRGKARHSTESPQRLYKSTAASFWREGLLRRAIAAVSLAPTAASSEQTASGCTIFLSYRRGDSSDITGRLYDRLEQEFGREAVFKDVDSIPLGTDFRAQIQSAVGQCQVLIAVIGGDWTGERQASGERRIAMANDFVRLEVEAAIARELPIIPILVQGAAMPQADELPASLQVLTFRHAMALRPDPDFHSDVGRLIRGVKALLTNIT